MRQRGFIQLPIMTWAVIGCGVAILLLMVAVKVQTARLDAAKAETVKVQADYDAFKAEVERFGREAKARADAERERNAKVSRERESSYEKRLASINDAYRRLREQSDSRGRDLPAVPSTARSADDATRDQQLQGVLRHADEQAARLIELQQWIREVTP